MTAASLRVYERGSRFARARAAGRHLHCGCPGAIPRATFTAITWIVVWNEHGHGYLVSVHFSGGRGPFRYSQRDRIEAALAIAESTTSVAG